MTLESNRLKTEIRPDDFFVLIWNETVCIGVAERWKNVQTSKGDYCIKKLRPF